MMTKQFDHTQSEDAMSRNAASLRGRTNRYYRWNLGVFPIEKHKKILDLGCGPAIYFNEIMEYSPSLYMATDYSENYIEEVRRVSGGHPNCHTLRLDLLDPRMIESLRGQRFDYVFCFDVLEHLEDDELALKNICRLMKMGDIGSLFLRVPALQSIYGENDKAIGHYRRYSARSLRELLESCSFHVGTLRYQNLPGVLPWYVIGRVLRRSLAVSESEVSTFNYVVPLIERAERILPPPFGLSLYCICTVKELVG